MNMCCCTNRVGSVKVVNDTNPRLRHELNTIFERGMSKNYEAVGEEFAPLCRFRALFRTKNGFPTASVSLEMHPRRENFDCAECAVSK